MAQRLALARLLLASPELWLLDEPASGLDDVGRPGCKRSKGLRDSGRIIAIASHSRQLVGALATHAVVLRKGRVGTRAQSMGQSTLTNYSRSPSDDVDYVGRKAIYRKDLAIERRSRETLFTVLSFGLLATLVFSLSFFIENDVSGAYAPGVIWIVVLFASTLGLQQLFDAERENDCFGGLLLAPIDLRGVYLGKLLVQLTFSGLMELCTVPLIFLFFSTYLASSMGRDS